MTTYLSDFLVNASYVEVINKFSDNIHSVFLALLQIFSLKKSTSADIYSYWETVTTFVTNLVEFDAFQIKILKALLLVLVFTILLIAIYWKFHGKVICERFMRPATSRAIEELKASVARLKLPKVHSPRI